MNDKFTLNNEACQFSERACRRNSAHMLPVTDWLCDLPETNDESDLVEVQFKNTRKAYFHNIEHLPLEKGTLVAVEANPGHDIGEVTLTGRLVHLQMRKYHIDLSRYEIRNIYRLATEQDLQRAEEAHKREHETMIKARQLAKSLGLEMKIGDVEYQGDGTKAIFYYIADGRVDFRELVKDLASVFRTRIELRQVGVRDETKIRGGIGICGRPLCCNTHLSDFIPVSIKMAKEQNLSLNPTKISGVCGRLMCCLKHEEDTYEELNRKLPNVGDYVTTPEGLKGEVSNVNVLRQLVKVVVEDGDEKEIHEYKAEELKFKRRHKKEKQLTKEEMKELAKLEKLDKTKGLDDN